MDGAYLSHRSIRTGDMESSAFGHCDRTSYLCFALSMALWGVGIIITVLALKDDALMFSALGHMWLVGPIFISSGLLVAVKTVLYLRKKHLLNMIIRQRALLRGMYGQDMVHQSCQSQSCVIRNPSSVTLPPAYDIAVGASGLASDGDLEMGEAPPPTYEEALFLIGEEKLKEDNLQVKESNLENPAECSKWSEEEGECKP